MMYQKRFVSVANLIKSCDPTKCKIGQKTEVAIVPALFRSQHLETPSEL